MDELNLIREITQIKSQLSYSKNMGYFFGAGASCALGLPDIQTLTNTVEKSLQKDQAEKFKLLKDDLESDSGEEKVNIEDILNQLRRIREITNENKEKNYNSIDGATAKQLDFSICKAIYEEISKKEKAADLKKTQKLLAWLNRQNRDFTKELFTTNYDLIVERSLENVRIPYFDGFVGAYEPFFWQDSIDREIDHRDITRNWIRLWKLHGSLGWYWQESNRSGSSQIVRLGKGKATDENRELVIYPSREKYDTSRKQPFIAYFDRLKDYLQSGELLFIITGYSFSDQHINDLIFNSLRQNPRLTVLAFLHTDDAFQKLTDEALPYLNLSLFSPSFGVVNGTSGKWIVDEGELTRAANHELYWDDSKKQLTVGDFNSLVDFLVSATSSEQNSSSQTDGS